MLIYLSGNAGDVELALIRLGHTPITVHPQMGDNCRHQAIARCDAVVFCEGWNQSEACLSDRAYAEDLHIPIYDAPDLPPLHPVEVACPQQVKAFAETLGKMHRVHLEKNHDYSPVAFAGTGEIGVASRIWEKTARLMNLVGFKIAIASSEFEQPKTPRNESKAETCLDLANQAVICQIVGQGKWGK